VEINLVICTNLKEIGKRSSKTMSEKFSISIETSTTHGKRESINTQI